MDFFPPQDYFDLFDDSSAFPLDNPHILWYNPTCSVRLGPYDLQTCAGRLNLSEQVKLLINVKRR